MGIFFDFQDDHINTKERYIVNKDIPMFDKIRLKTFLYNTGSLQ